MANNGYQKCYIAFLDLLGLKNLVRTYPCDKILDIYKRSCDMKKLAKLAAYETYQPIVKAVSPAYKVVIAFR